jgi:predicted nucleic acid-binding protein
MLLIDANVLFSVLIKGEFTLELLYLLKKAGYRLVTCTFVIDEIEENKEKILRYSKFSESEIKFILDGLVKEIIELFSKERFEEFVPEASEICSDKDDVPYVALSLALDKAPVWSNDKELKIDCEKVSIEVFSTEGIKSLLFIIKP